MERTSFSAFHPRVAAHVGPNAHTFLDLVEGYLQAQRWDREDVAARARAAQAVRAARPDLVISEEDFLHVIYDFAPSPAPGRQTLAEGSSAAAIAEAVRALCAAEGLCVHDPAQRREALQRLVRRGHLTPPAYGRPQDATLAAVAARHGLAVWRAGDYARARRLALAERGATVDTAETWEDAFLLLAEGSVLNPADVGHRVLLTQTLMRRRPDLVPDYRPPASWRATRPDSTAAPPAAAEASAPADLERIARLVQGIATRAGLDLRDYRQRARAFALLYAERPELADLPPPPAA